MRPDAGHGHTYRCVSCPSGSVATFVHSDETGHVRLRPVCPGDPWGLLIFLPLVFRSTTLAQMVQASGGVAPAMSGCYDAGDGRGWHPARVVN